MTINDIARTAAGSPNGGQFAAKPGRSEADVSCLACPHSLDEQMEFGAAYAVNAAGHANSVPDYAPSYMDDEPDSSDWEAISGYSGQYSYNGPVMHESEYLGGAIEQHILDNPGIYAITEATYTTDADGNEIGEDDELISGGWVLLRKKDTETTQATAAAAHREDMLDRHGIAKHNTAAAEYIERHGGIDGLTTERSTKALEMYPNDAAYMVPRQ